MNTPILYGCRMFIKNYWQCSIIFCSKICECTSSEAYHQGTCILCWLYIRIKTNFSKGTPSFRCVLTRFIKIIFSSRQICIIESRTRGFWNPMRTKKSHFQIEKWIKPGIFYAKNGIIFTTWLEALLLSLQNVTLMRSAIHKIFSSWHLTSQRILQSHIHKSKALLFFPFDLHLLVLISVLETKRLIRIA